MFFFSVTSDCTNYGLPPLHSGWAIIFETGENPQVNTYHGMETNMEFLEISPISSQVQFGCRENITDMFKESTKTGGVLKLILQYDGQLFSLLIAPNGTESYLEEAVCFREEITDLAIDGHYLQISGGNGDRVILHELNWWFLTEINGGTRVTSSNGETTIINSLQSSTTLATSTMGSTVGSTVGSTTIRPSSTTAKATTVKSNAPPKS